MIIAITKTRKKIIDKESHRVKLKIFFCVNNFLNQRSNDRKKIKSEHTLIKSILFLNRALIYRFPAKIKKFCQNIVADSKMCAFDHLSCGTIIRRAQCMWLNAIKYPTNRQKYVEPYQMFRDRNCINWKKRAQCRNEKCRHRKYCAI